MEVLDEVRGQDRVIDIPEGLIGRGPSWNGHETYECLVCGGDFYRDLSLERTMEHAEKFHGAMFGSRVAESVIVDASGRPYTRHIPAALFGPEEKADFNAGHQGSAGRR